MKQWLVGASEYAVLIIDAMALIAIAIGTFVAFAAAVRLAASRVVNGSEPRSVWLHYGRWLVAGLTFQLAADIIESSITTSWDAVGRLAAIAAIRTGLNYFLERDLAEARQREVERTTEAAAPS